MEELTFDYAPNSNDQDSGIDCSKSVSLDLSSLQEKKTVRFRESIARAGIRHLVKLYNDHLWTRKSNISICNTQDCDVEGGTTCSNSVADYKESVEQVVRIERFL